MRAKEGRGGIMERRREEAFGGLCSGSFFDVRGYRPIDRPTDILIVLCVLVAFGK